MQGSPPRRLTRSHDRRLGGVCGGIAEYFDLDPTLVRVASVLLIFLTAGAGGLLVYFLLWLVMPESADRPGAAPASPAQRRGPNIVLALVLLVLFFGVLALREATLFTWFHGGLFRFSWPLALVLVIVLLVMSRRRN